jgi:hypothetical protein
MVFEQESFASVNPDASESLESEESASGPACPTDFLPQCLRTFTEWRDSLDGRSDRLEGNFVAFPEIDSCSGSVRIAKTVVVDVAETEENDQVYLGDQGKLSDLVHGSVIALHSVAHDRFVQMTASQTKSRSSQVLGRLPKAWERELFLVVHLGYQHLAFYNVNNGKFLGINSVSRFAHGYWPGNDLLCPGIDDGKFLDSTPKAAIFVVQRERSDGSVISIFSKYSKTFLRMAEDGTVDAKPDGSSAWKNFRIVVVMNSKHIVRPPGSFERAWSVECATTSTIQQCYSTFVSWKNGLNSFSGCFDGNLMSTVQVVAASGDVLAPVTKVIRTSTGTNTLVQLGKVVPSTRVSHGNVVALYHEKSGLFLETNFNQVRGGSKGTAGKLKLTDYRPNLLVISSGDNRFSFYSICHDQFLVLKSPTEMVCLQPNVSLRTPCVSDDVVLDRVPDGAWFYINQEGSDGYQISLLSEKFQTYVTIDDGGKANAMATSPGDSQLFQIVLIMSVDWMSS